MHVRPVSIGVIQFRTWLLEEEKKKNSAAGSLSCETLRVAFMCWCMYVHISTVLVTAVVSGVASNCMHGWHR